jgi:hypothetical protein
VLEARLYTLIAETRLGARRAFNVGAVCLGTTGCQPRLQGAGIRAYKDGGYTRRENGNERDRPGYNDNKARGKSRSGMKRGGIGGFDSLRWRRPPFAVGIGWVSEGRRGVWWMTPTI